MSFAKHADPSRGGNKVKRSVAAALATGGLVMGAVAASAAVASPATAASTNSDWQIVTNSSWTSSSCNAQRARDLQAGAGKASSCTKAYYINGSGPYWGYHVLWV